jgi:hypothetical protein
VKHDLKGVLKYISVKIFIHPLPPPTDRDSSDETTGELRGAKLLLESSELPLGNLSLIQRMLHKE